MRETMMVDVFREISEEAHKQLVDTAVNTVLYVAMGSVMKQEIAKKYPNVAGMDIEVILARVSDDLNRRIKKIQLVK